MDLGGNFNIEELKVGQHKTDTSIRRMWKSWRLGGSSSIPSCAAHALGDGGIRGGDQLEKVTTEGVFPEGFYPRATCRPRC
jgi:hypothetical protein